MPFGGTGESGHGKYHGKSSFDTFSHMKSVLSRPFVGDVMVRYPPFTPEKQRVLRPVVNIDLFGFLLGLLLSFFRLQLNRIRLKSEQKAVASTKGGCQGNHINPTS